MSTSAGSPPGAEQDSDDDGLDVVPDIIHSVAREEAVAHTAAGHTRPSVSCTTQLRFACVVDLLQSSDAHRTIPTIAAQSTFISSLARGGAVTGTQPRGSSR